MPAGIWSAALIAPLLSPDATEAVAYSAPLYTGLAMTVFAQCTLIYYLDDVVTEGDDEPSCDGDFACRAVCLCVVTAFVAYSELLETMRLRRWIRMIPKWDEEKHRPIVDKTLTCLAVKRITTEGDESIYALATGITDRYRAFAIIFLVIPKLAIAAVTLVYAAGYVLYAETVEGVYIASESARPIFSS